MIYLKQDLKKNKSLNFILFYIKYNTTFKTYFTGLHLINLKKNIFFLQQPTEKKLSQNISFIT